MDEAMVVISITSWTEPRGSLKESMKKSVLYILFRFAMQFSITIGTNRTRRDKVK
jgi:hypothetical protein